MSGISVALNTIRTAWPQQMTRAEFTMMLNVQASGRFVQYGEMLHWGTSFTDFMKLAGRSHMIIATVNLNTLATELGYPGTFDGSPEMNRWVCDKLIDLLNPDQLAATGLEPAPPILDEPQLSTA